LLDALDIKNRHRLVDPAGLLCMDDDDAITKAKVLAVQVGLDTPSSDPKRHIAVIDDAGSESFER
jgi:hypothetical protein